MKHTIRKLNYYLLLFTALIFISCEKDLYDEALTNEGKSRIANVTLDDLPFLRNDINQKINKNKVFAKAGDIDYLSLLITDNVIVMTDDAGKKSYTFSINLNEADKLTNVVIKETEEGLKYNLVEYTSNEFQEWFNKILSNEYTNIEPDVKITEISGKMQDCHTYVIDYVCPSGMHTHGEEDVCNYATEEWTLTITITTVECGGGDGGDGGGGLGGIGTDSGGIGNTGSTGTTSGNSSNTNPGSGGILTTPKPCLLCAEPDDMVDTPCQDIKKKTNSVLYMNKFNLLNTPIKFTLNHESGFSETASNAVIQYPNNSILASTNSVISMLMPPGAYSYTHVHVIKNIMCSDGIERDLGVKIHSPRDLIQITSPITTQDALAGGMTTNDIYGVVISNLGIFSLTLIDSNIDNATFNSNYNTFVEDYNDKSKTILTNDDLSNEQKAKALQLMLLKGLKSLGLQNNVALFEGEVEIDIITGKGEKINWTRKTLDHHENDIIKNPC